MTERKQKAAWEKAKAEREIFALLVLVDRLAACPLCGEQHPVRYTCTLGIYESDPLREARVLARAVRKELHD